MFSRPARQFGPILIAGRSLVTFKYPRIAAISSVVVGLLQVGDIMGVSQICACQARNSSVPLPCQPPTDRSGPGNTKMSHVLALPLRTVLVDAILTEAPGFRLRDMQWRPFQKHA